MKTINVSFLAAIVLMCVASPNSLSKENCGINKISAHNPGNSGYSVNLGVTSGYKISIAKKNDKQSFDLKEKIALGQNKNLADIEAEDDDIIYLTDGRKQGCIVMRGERDGKKGFYVEHHENVMNLPPVLVTRFIEAD